MSESYRVVTFSQLIEQGLLEIGDGYRAKLDELGGEGPIFLRAGLLTAEGINWSPADRFHAGLLPKIASKLGRPGDTMVTTKGNSVGRAAFVPENAPQFVYSPHLSYWRSRRQDELDPRFLYYWSRSKGFRSQLESMAGSTDMAPYLSLTDQYRLHISLPNHKTQVAAARVLGALDDKIAANDRMIRTSEKLAISLALDGARNSNVALRELALHVRRSVIPESVAADFVAHYSLPAFDRSQLPDIVRPSSIKSDKFVIRAPSVLVSKLNPSTPRVWDLGVLPSRPALASTEFVVLQPTHGISTHELWAACSQTAFAEELSTKATGTSNSHQRVNPEEILAASVVDPRQMADATRSLISDLAAGAARARSESSVLAALRDTLLPQLMTGEIRVREAENMIEDAT